MHPSNEGTQKVNLKDNWGCQFQKWPFHESRPWESSTIIQLKYMISLMMVFIYSSGLC